MPYIITTTTPFSINGQGRSYNVTRHAVATLDEARTTAEEIIDRTDVAVVSEYQDAALALPEAGGTIGPLPDGTVIEVEYVDSGTFAKLAWPLLFPDDDEDTVRTTNLRKLLDAYNAAQEA